MDNITSVEYDLYQSHIQKLKDFCKSAELLFALECGRYPITLTIRPDEYYHQMSLLESAERRRADAAMTFTLAEGEIRITAVGGFVISDAAFSKIKGLFQKISAYWTQLIFRWQALQEGAGLFNLWNEVKERPDDEE